MYNILKLSKVSLLNFKFVRKIIKEYNYSNLDNSFNFNGLVFVYIITGKCFFIYKGTEIRGLLLINNNKCQINFIPIIRELLTKDDYLYLINLINTNFSIRGYSLIFKFKNDCNIDEYHNQYQFNIIQKIKYMSMDLNEIDLKSKILTDDLKVSKLDINYEGEEKRVFLQNKIFQFENANGRTDLTIEEVYMEESSPGFIQDLCLTLDLNNNSIGYGQIILIKNRFFLVNFGIIPDYQGKGLGSIFLSEIINRCISYGINSLCLTVDNNNLSAVKLYKSIGFKDEYIIEVIKYI